MSVARSCMWHVTMSIGHEEDAKGCVWCTLYMLVTFEYQCGDFNRATEGGVMVALQDVVVEVSESPRWHQSKLLQIVIGGACMGCRGIGKLFEDMESKWGQGT